jgi:myo-inositol-1(or 4)-monophosphatase
MRRPVSGLTRVGVSNEQSASRRPKKPRSRDVCVRLRAAAASRRALGRRAMDRRVQRRAALPPTAVRPETAAAVRAARLAQRIADSRAGAHDIRAKEGIDIVTAADVACEDAIRGELTRAFPGYPVIGEERGGDERTGVPYWLVDPICGTRCYASNVPLYCTNIALVENGEVTAAAIGVGVTGEVLFAEKGNGARVLLAPGDRHDGALGSSAPAAVSDASNVLWIHGYGPAMADFARRMWLANRWYLWTFTSTVAYAYLAMGRVAGLVHIAQAEQHREPPVHTAAGCLVAAEAGATVTDLDSGAPWSLATRSFVAAPAALHRELGALARAAA